MIVSKSISYAAAKLLVRSWDVSISNMTNGDGRLSLVRIGSREVTWSITYKPRPRNCHTCDSWLTLTFAPRCQILRVLNTIARYFCELFELEKPKGSIMMPPLGLQIYLRPRVTLTFDLLTPKVESFTPVQCAPWTACANLHQNRFIRFQNVVFTIL